MSKTKESPNQPERAMLESLERARLIAPQDYAALHVATLPRQNSAMAYYEFGDPNGKPLLCLHGMSVSGLSFEPFHAWFAQIGVRAIAPCLMGGVYDADPARTIDDLAAGLVELLDTLGIGEFDMVGFSWGTVVELALLARVPQRIRKAGLVGAMTPMDFADSAQLAALKSDVRLTLKMAGGMPLVHRCLMWLVCKLPVSTLMDQFKDDTLSRAEQEAMTPGTDFYRYFSRCISECTRTGSRFFTDGWRMFLDKPAYALAALAAARDVRLYVAENDNVHLPYFSARIAGACAGVPADQVMQSLARPGFGPASALNLVYVQNNTSVWLQHGAGRMACVLNLKDTLVNLLLTETQTVVAA
jgi:pimeloyl-ACP methyl ester carboxylesterase